MHPARTDRGDRRPDRIVAHVRREIAVDGDDHIGIPQQHLLDRDVGEPALAFGRDVLRAEEFDGLDIDRAAEPGLEPARPARVIDARPPALRNAYRSASGSSSWSLRRSAHGLPPAACDAPARRACDKSARSRRTGHPAARRESRSAPARASASDTKVGAVEPTSRIRSGLSASTTSRLAVLPRPVMRPISGRVQTSGSM